MGIRVLPKVLADKIAAGEVIERPASVVKEAVENSLDAGAGRIGVELEDGGSRLVRVVDDGCGMDEGDLALAFLSHSTSKLRSEEDLFNVRTMGFRGEALASIAAVSQARLLSRTRGSEAGWEVRAEGGVIGEVRACPAPPGTVLEVRNLFYNVPVRRRFLRSPATEMAHVTEALTRLALAHPEVAFTLTHNGRRVFELPPARDRGERIAEFFGREIAEKLIPLSARREEVELEGYLLPPSVDRAGTTMQYTYVNRRFVRERTLMHAIAEAYRGLLMPNRRAACFLFLTVEPAQVDVNVHPSKIEVRFRDARRIHAHVLSAMQEALRGADLTPQVSLRPGREGPEEERKAAVRSAVAEFFAGRAEARDAPQPAGGGARAPAEAPGPDVVYGNTAQMLDTYIVEEVPEGIRITDQHALHERILYEGLRRRLREGPLPGQRLLVPELVELPRAEFQAVLELRDELSRLGLEMEPFGERTLIVRSFPQVLGRFDGAAFFRELLDELEGPEGARRVDGRIERLLRMMACRGAVKAGERLSPAQMKALLRERARCGACETCPHGRPTSIVITRRELERHFRRT